MRKLLTIFFLVTLSISSVIAQNNINKVEYFIDADPGYGLATPVSFSPTEIVDINFNANLAGYTSGLHFLYIRAANNNGWGITYIHPLLIEANSPVVSVPDLILAEYFIDADPGFGLATPLSFSPGKFVDKSFNADLNGLPPGLHMLHIRAKDQKGIWGTAFSKPFLVLGNLLAPDITEIEYFVDSDPGFGMANAVAVPYPSTSLDESFIVDLAGVSLGLHILGVRAKNASGIWSHVFSKPFLLVGSQITPLVSDLEYFIDTDPGLGNATKVNISPAAIVDKAFIVDLAGLPDGMHVLHIRAKNENGFWSSSYIKPFIKLGNITEPNITFLEYSIDSYSYGQGTPIPISPDKLINKDITIDLSGITPGSHMLYIAAMDENNNWSVVHRESFCIGSQADFYTDTVCVGMPTTFFDVSVDADTAQTQYSWDIDNNGTIDFETKGNISFTYPAPGTYTAALILNKDSLCPDTVIRTVIVHSAVIASFVTDSVCFGASTTFTDLSTGTDSSTVYQWDIDNNGTAEYTTQGNITHKYLQKGNHTASLIIYNYPICPDTAVVDLYVDSTTVDAAFVTDVACIGNATIFTDLSTGTDGTTTYSWDINNNGSVDYATIGNITHVYPATGTHTATLILNSNAICPDTFSLNVQVDSIGSISGKVRNENGPINNGYVLLFAYQTNSVMPLKDSVLIGTAGDYFFNDVTPGNYVVRAHPDTSIYSSNLVTYYDSTFQWLNAKVINSLCDTSFDIGLLTLSQGTGSGIISGFVVQAGDFKAEGDPIPGIDVSLEQKPGGIIKGQTQTDSLGYYRFTGVETGNYTIYVDIPGLGMDSSYSVVITDTDTSFEDLNYWVDSASIFIQPVNGVTEAYKGENYEVRVYPNPYTSHTNINYILNSESRVSVEVYNLLGSKVHTLVKSQSQRQGHYRYEFSASRLGYSRGIYLVRMEIDGQVHLIKIIEIQ